MIEKILDFGDVQKFQERFHIPFTSSITRWTYETINAFHSEGEESIELWLAYQILPESYTTNPYTWINNTISKKIKYSEISARCEAGYVILTCQNTKIATTKFMPNLVATLQLQKSVTYELEELPNAYQSNPYQLIYKLRTQKKMSVEVNKIGNRVTVKLI